MRSIIFAELFGDFVNLAKESLREGYKDVAAVLACAALEDVLKQFAQKNGLSVEDKDISQVINSLKSESLVSGAQKSMLDVMPKIRNYAMHANWSKITDVDVSSVIGFVEQFLLSNL
jgi:ribosomal protein L20A (L18A)